jgi:hypothetical protein
LLRAIDSYGIVRCSLVPHIRSRVRLLHSCLYAVSTKSARCRGRS